VYECINENNPSTEIEAGLIPGNLAMYMLY